MGITEKTYYHSYHNGVNYLGVNIVSYLRLSYTKVSLSFKLVYTSQNVTYSVLICFEGSVSDIGVGPKKIGGMGGGGRRTEYLYNICHVLVQNIQGFPPWKYMTI